MEVRGPHLLPPGDFPITIRCLRSDTDELVWQTTLEKPDGLASVYVPPLRRIHGVPIVTEVQLADGEVTRTTSE
jgi:hypothetical protein